MKQKEKAFRRQRRVAAAKARGGRAQKAENRSARGTKRSAHNTVPPPSAKRRKTADTPSSAARPVRPVHTLPKATALSLAPGAAPQTIAVTNKRKAGVSANWKQLKQLKVARSSSSAAAPPTDSSSTSTQTGRVSKKKWKAYQQAQRNDKYGPKRDKLAFSVGDAPSANLSLTKVVAVDCEMVGVGLNAEESMLARVSIVNSFGNILLDTFVKPQEPVVDYRTKYSGVRPADIENAPSFQEVQAQVAEIFKGRIVVGHSIENDFQALMLSHPKSMIRDTAEYRPLQRRRGVPHALKALTNKYLGVKIQSAEHSSVEDARATLLIYQMHRTQWEAYLKAKIKQKKKKKGGKKSNKKSTKSE